MAMMAAPMMIGRGVQAPYRTVPAVGATTKVRPMLAAMRLAFLFLSGDQQCWSGGVTRHGDTQAQADEGDQSEEGDWPGIGDQHEESEQRNHAAHTQQGGRAPPGLWEQRLSGRGSCRYLRPGGPRR